MYGTKVKILYLMGLSIMSSVYCQLAEDGTPNCEPGQAARPNRRASSGEVGSTCGSLSECNPGLTCCSHESRGNIVTVCSDINECDTSPCDQTCINTEGGFMCFCEEGDLAADGTSCITEELALVEEKRGENDDVVTTEATVIECPDGYVLNPHERYCVKLYDMHRDGGITWWDAKSACEENGETLMVLAEQTDIEWYRDLRRDIRDWHQAHHVWIGGFKDENKDWHWQGRIQAPILTFDWHRGEDSGRRGENCMQLWQYKMDDSVCEKRHGYFACERSINNPPSK